MSQNINNIFDSLTNMLVSIAKHGDEEEINKVIEIMEIGWKQMDEVLDNSWFNQELAKSWRKTHK